MTEFCAAAAYFCYKYLKLFQYYRECIAFIYKLLNGNIRRESVGYIGEDIVIFRKSLSDPSKQTRSNLCINQVGLFCSEVFTCPLFFSRIRYSFLPPRIIQSAQPLFFTKAFHRSNVCGGVNIWWLCKNFSG